MSKESLALYGGTPVRTNALPPSNPGAAVYGEQERDAAAEVIMAKSPYRYYGPHLLGKTRAFERQVANKLGGKNVVAVSSCTASLVVALKAAGIGPGDKVIVPACTFIATPGAVVCAGAVPVFADIDDSLNIDPDRFEALIDEDTKAIITVPIYGNPCDMDRILPIARRHGLMVIEDVAQSLGATYKGRYCGTIGDLNCFSLQLNKILTTGEGGFVLTDDDKLYERAVRYHDQGLFREKEGFLNVDENADIFVGQNYRMSEITAAVAGVQLEKLDDIIQKMRHVKHRILDGIKDVPGLHYRRIVDADGDACSTIVFLMDSKEQSARFREAMVAEGIRMNYLYNGEPIYMVPQMLHQKTVDRNNFPFNMLKKPVTYTPDMCPAAVDLMARNAVINLGPTWTDQDCDDVIAAIRKVAPVVL